MDILKIAEGVLIDGRKLSQIETKAELIEIFETLGGEAAEGKSYDDLNTETLIKMVIDTIVEEVKAGKAERKSDGYAIERVGSTRRVDIADFRKELEQL